MGGLARGIDRISITENSATTHGYPLYDGHGNCRAILTRDGTDDYATGNWRTYDVWGSVRSGSATGDPKSRYVASIEHVADDESSLIYMRARYYEPATGRFLSWDSKHDGWNWYIYSWNDPVNKLDVNGHSAIYWITAAGILFGFFGSLAAHLLAGKDLDASTWTDAAWGGATGGLVAYATTWINAWLEKYVLQGVLRQGLAHFAAGAGGLGAVVVLLYAKRAGEILYELFEFQMHDNMRRGAEMRRRLGKPPRVYDEFYLH